MTNLNNDHWVKNIWSSEANRLQISKRKLNKQIGIEQTLAID